MPGLKSPFFAELTANKIASSLNEPLEIGGQTFCIKVNIGIAIADTGGNSAEALHHNEDAAMLQSRKTQQQYCTAETIATGNSSARKMLDYELDQAISRNELQIYYQPKVNLASQTFSGVEALVR